MHLQLTPEEFQRLLKFAYLGEAVFNDWTPAESLSDDQRASTDLLYELCARASQTPSAELVEFDEETGEWLPSKRMRDEMNAVLGDYDNDVFWEELVRRLAHRDLVTEYGHETLANMSDRHRQLAESPLLEHHWNEVRTHGIDRFQMPDDSTPRMERRREPRSTKGRGKQRPSM